MVEHEDALQEVALEAALKDARPKHGKRAIEVGKVELTKGKIDTKAYDYFISRGGKSKIKVYDQESPKDNVKSDKRWFNRG